MTPWQALRTAGVLGINRRNNRYTLRCNPRHLYPLVDDKLQTKNLCERAGVPTARLLAVARRMGDVALLSRELAGYEDFVLKPAHGAMGNGIMVIVGREDGRLRRAGGGWLSEEDVRYHASSILSGLYALGGNPDAAFAEERLIVHPELVEVCAAGVPDLRIIVYRGVPVMAMTRLPTRRARGRANLHQGAVGAGVDLVTGRLTDAVLMNRACTEHPDTGETLRARPFPAFDRALEIAVRATVETGLGYVGADVVVDARYGALILELNARPGLAVQIANRTGLQPRLEAIDAAWRPDLSLPERIALGQAIQERT